MWHAYTCGVQSATFNLAGPHARYLLQITGLCTKVQGCDHSRAPCKAVRPLAQDGLGAFVQSIDCFRLSNAAHWQDMSAAAETGVLSGSPVYICTWKNIQELELPARFK